MSPLVWPILLPLWLRLGLQARWDGLCFAADLASAMVLSELRGRLLAALDGVDKERAIDLLMEAEAGEYSARQEADELRVRLELRDLMEARRSEPPAAVGRSCESCRYFEKLIFDEPCARCSVEVPYSRWEPKEVIT